MNVSRKPSKSRVWDPDGWFASDLPCTCGATYGSGEDHADRNYGSRQRWRWLPDSNRDRRRVVCVLRPVGAEGHGIRKTFEAGTADKKSFQPEKLANVTPEHRKFCEELIRGAVFRSLYTPLGLTKMILSPSTNSAQIEGGGSFDPPRRLFT
jgi:hypothetical protein